MKDSLWLIRRTLLSMMRSYKSLLIYMLAPIIGIVLAFLIYGGGSGGASSLSVGVVDLDMENAGASTITRDLLTLLDSEGAMEINRLQNVGEAEEGVLGGELDAAIIIPAGFAQTVKEGLAGSEAGRQMGMELEVVALKGSEAAPYVKKLLTLHMDSWKVMAAAAMGDAEVFDERYAAYGAAGFVLSKEVVADRSAQRDMTNRSIGYLVVFMMFSAVNLSVFMIKERENRTYYRLLASPISAGTYVASNVASNLLLLVLQITIVLTVMSVGFGIDPGVPIWQLALALFLFAWVAVGLSLAIVAFSRNAMTAAALQNMLIIPTCLLAGCMFPIETMPSPIRAVADFLPQRWLLETIDGLQSGASNASLAVHGLALIAFALTFSLAAAYKFGRNRDTRTFI